MSVIDKEKQEINADRPRMSVRQMRDEMKNCNARAQRRKHAIDIGSLGWYVNQFLSDYQERAGVTESRSVRDVLAELMNACDARGLDFEDTLKDARAEYMRDLQRVMRLGVA